jgi:hypothetical protein
MSRQSKQRNSRAKNSRTNSRKSRSSIRLVYTVPIMILGFFLVSTSTSLTNLGGFQDMLFVFGILLWFFGFMGTVYAIVNRLAGPRAATWAVVLLTLALLTQVIFGAHEERDND